MTLAADRLQSDRISLLRDYVRVQYETLRPLSPELQSLRARARARVEQRLSCLDDRPTLRPASRHDMAGAFGAGVPTLGCDRVELMIVDLLATGAHLQFSVSSRDARIFAGALRGYHHEPDRLYVTGLSTILDAAADRLHSLSNGSGGRFYVNDDFVERAWDRSVLLRLALAIDEPRPCCGQ